MWIYIGDKSYKGLKTYRCSNCCCMVHVEEGLPELCPNCGERNMEMKNMTVEQLIKKLTDERDMAIKQLNSIGVGLGDNMDHVKDALKLECKDCAGCFQWRCDVANIIQDFAEAVKLEFYKEFEEIIPSVMSDRIDALVRERTGE